MPPKKFEKPPGLSDIKGKFTKKSQVDTHSYADYLQFPRTISLPPPVAHSGLTKQGNGQKNAGQVFRSSIVESRSQPIQGRLSHLHAASSPQLNNIVTSVPESDKLSYFHRVVNPEGVTTIALSPDGHLILPHMEEVQPNSRLGEHSTNFSEINCPTNLSTNQERSHPVTVSTNNNRFSSSNLTSKQFYVSRERVNQNTDTVIATQGDALELEYLLHDFSSSLRHQEERYHQQRPTCLAIPSILVQKDPLDPLGMRQKLPAQFRSFERYLEGKFGLDEFSGNARQSRNDFEDDADTRSLSLLNSFVIEDTEVGKPAEDNFSCRPDLPASRKTSKDKGGTDNFQRRRDFPLPKLPIGNASLDRLPVKMTGVNPSNLAVLGTLGLGFNDSNSGYFSLQNAFTAPQHTLDDHHETEHPPHNNNKSSASSFTPSVTKSDLPVNHVSHTSVPQATSPSFQSTTYSCLAELSSPTREVKTDPPVSNTNGTSQRAESMPPTASSSHLKDPSSSATANHRQFYSQEVPSSTHSGVSSNHNASNSSQQTPDLVFLQDHDYSNFGGSLRYSNGSPKSVNIFWPFSFPNVIFTQITSLVWPDCDRFYLSIRDYLEADYKTSIPLPSNWTQGRSPMGRAYYACEDSRITSWHHPILGPRVPFGWQRVDSLSEGIYYINFFMKHSQRHHPNLWIVARLKDTAIEEDPCFMRLRLIQNRPVQNIDCHANIKFYYSSSPGIDEHRFILQLPRLQIDDLIQASNEIDKLFGQEVQSIIVAYESYRAALVRELFSRRPQSELFGILEHNQKISRNLTDNSTC